MMNLDEMSNAELFELQDSIMEEIMQRLDTAQARVDELEMPAETPEDTVDGVHEFSMVNFNARRIDLCEIDFAALEGGATYINIPGQYDIEELRGWVAFYEGQACRKRLKVTTGFSDAATTMCPECEMEKLIERGLLGGVGGMSRDELDKIIITRIWLR